MLQCLFELLVLAGRGLVEWVLSWILPEKLEMARADTRVREIEELTATFRRGRDAVKLQIAAVDSILDVDPRSVSEEDVAAIAGRRREEQQLTAQIKGCQKARFDALIAALQGKPWPHRPEINQD